MKLIHKKDIKKLVDIAVENLNLGNFDMSQIIAVRPENKKFGFKYATNAPFVIASKLERDAREISELLKKELEKIKGLEIEKIETLGFVNFYLAKDCFVENIKKINKDFGRGKELQNKKVIIDYTDPNILKEFHIGHLMSNTIGESLSRIFEFQGAGVKRVCYQSDVGISVAKALWGIINMQNPNFGKEGQYAKFLGMAYAFGSAQYEEDEDAKKEIIILNKKIFERSDKEINKTYDQWKKWSLDYFDEIYKRLGTKFDYFIFESEVVDLAKKIVEKGLEDGIFEKGEKGAIIFKGEEYGLHTRVFINSEGLPTYEAKDLGLAETKYKKYKYDLSFIVTGNEVNDYFKVMLCAMDKITSELAKKTKHIGHGMLRLPEGKMSSRTGKVVTAESLIEKVEELVSEKIKDRDISDKEKKEIVEKVAIGAIKYSILKQSIGSDIVYDFDKSISFDGDSGPYLQYSYTRAVSVLRKAKDDGVKPSFKKVPDEIMGLEKIMYDFEEIVEEAGENYIYPQLLQPHIITIYLIELAREFNNYYAKNKIVDKNDELSPYRVALTNAFAIIMKNGLNLLGIETLEKM